MLSSLHPNVNSILLPGVEKYEVLPLSNLGYMEERRNDCTTVNWNSYI